MPLMEMASSGYTLGALAGQDKADGQAEEDLDLPALYQHGSGQAGRNLLSVCFYEAHPSRLKFSPKVSGKRSYKGWLL